MQNDSRCTVCNQWVAKADRTVGQLHKKFRSWNSQTLCPILYLQQMLLVFFFYGRYVFYGGFVSPRALTITRAPNNPEFPSTNRISANDCEQPISESYHASGTMNSSSFFSADLSKISELEFEAKGQAVVNDHHIFSFDPHWDHVQYKWKYIFSPPAATLAALTLKDTTALHYFPDNPLCFLSL